MAINFPSSPSVDDTFTVNNVTYTFDGTKWINSTQLPLIPSNSIGAEELNVTLNDISDSGNVGDALLSDGDGSFSWGDITPKNSTISFTAGESLAGGGTITLDQSTDSTIEFSVDQNSIGADKLNISGDGTAGQVLLSDGDGSFSWQFPISSIDGLTDGVNDGESVGVGSNVLVNDDGAQNNHTAVGFNSLSSVTTQNNNTAVGSNSLSSSTGNLNTALGSNAGNEGSGNSLSGTNVTLIGFDSHPSSFTVSNEITLGNNFVSRFRIPGLNLDTASAMNGQALIWDGGAFIWETPGATITDDNTTDTTVFPVLSTSTNGSLTAANVSTLGLKYNPSTGTLEATDFNSLSDERVKNNIHTIETPIEKILSLRGVSFEFKNSGKKSIGVVAQELETVLPELIHTGSDGFKSVSYGNIVGLLIEAIKDQQSQIDNLKDKLSNK